MQVLFTLPSFQEHYVDGANEVFAKTRFEPNHKDNFHHQMAKLGIGLCSGQYSVAPPYGDDMPPGEGDGGGGIRPVLFKGMIGKGHSEFSTKQQQDAQEFFLHLITVMEREDRKAGITENHAFRPLQFEVEDRHQCDITKKVLHTNCSYYFPETINLLKCHSLLSNVPAGEIHVASGGLPATVNTHGPGCQQSRGVRISSQKGRS